MGGIEVYWGRRWLAAKARKSTTPRSVEAEVWEPHAREWVWATFSEGYWRRAAPAPHGAKGGGT